MASTHICFDWAIKRLLRQKANFGILEGFLTELLGFDVTISSIGESEGNQADNNDKYNRVDILAYDQSGELVLIEVQNEKKHNYFHRMNYGQAKLICDHIHSGDDYDKVRKVYSVNIVYFELGQGNDYVYKGQVDFYGIHHKNDKLQLSEKQKELYCKEQVADIFSTYYIIKTNNFDDNAKDNLDEWIYFLKNNEFPQTIHAKGLLEAKDKLRTDNLPLGEKYEYEQYMKDICDRESEIATAFYDGQVKARKEAKQAIEKERAEKEKAQAEKEQERIAKEQAQLEKEKAQAEKDKTLSLLENMVKNLHSKGFTIEEIADNTGITVAQVKEIIEQ